MLLMCVSEQEPELDFFFLLVMGLIFRNLAYSQLHLKSVGVEDAQHLWKSSLIMSNFRDAGKYK